VDDREAAIALGQTCNGTPCPSCAEERAKLESDLIPTPLEAEPVADRETWLVESTIGDFSRFDYRFALDHIEKLLDRRQATTSFYISINAAIAAAIAFLLKDSPLARDWLWTSVFLLLLTGFIACLIWFSLLHQYSSLLNWWYAQLRDLEGRMPDSAKLITREYEAFYKDEKSRSWLQKVFKRAGMTEREQLLAAAIACLYLVFAVGALVTALL
jgi:hypothetical protein